MNGGVIPHHRQAAYDRGYADGKHLGFWDGYLFGTLVALGAVVAVVLLTVWWLR